MCQLDNDQFAPMAAADEKAPKHGSCSRLWALHLEWVNLQKNEARLYLLSWAPTLFGWGLLRTYGRIGHWQ